MKKGISMESSSEPAVMIVGAGPVGLITALVLAQQGIASRVIEAEPGLTIDLRAGTFHPPTLEMLDGIGATEMFHIFISSAPEDVRRGAIGTVVPGYTARVVGDDGHVIEGEYTFNASPDYGAEQSPMPISANSKGSSIPAGGILLAALIAVFLGGILMRTKNRRDE